MDKALASTVRRIVVAWLRHYKSYTEAQLQKFLESRDPDYWSKVKDEYEVARDIRNYSTSK